MPTSTKRADNAAVAALDAVTAPPQDAVLDEPTPIKKRRDRRKGSALPENLGPAILELGVTLRTLSIGKPIANVQATLIAELDTIHADEVADLMGERAWAVAFRNEFIGEGALVKASPITTDVENGRHQKVKFSLPRVVDGTDQIRQHLAQFFPDPAALDALLNLDHPWRLNITMDEVGVLTFYGQQQKFDLTTKAPEDLTGSDTTDEPE